MPNIVRITIKGGSGFCPVDYASPALSPTSVNIRYLFRPRSGCHDKTARSPSNRLGDWRTDSGGGNNMPFPGYPIIVNGSGVGF